MTAKQVLIKYLIIDHVKLFFQSLWLKPSINPVLYHTKTCDKLKHMRLSHFDRALYANWSLSPSCPNPYVYNARFADGTTHATHSWSRHRHRCSKPIAWLQLIKIEMRTVNTWRWWEFVDRIFYTLPSPDLKGTQGSCLVPKRPPSGPGVVNPFTKHCPKYYDVHLFA